MSQPNLTTGITPIAAVPARKSFAQVAAAANKPIIKKVAPPQVPPSSSTPKLVAKPIDKGPAAKPTVKDDPEMSVSTKEVHGLESSEATNGVDTVTHSLDVTHLDGTSAATSQTGHTKKDNSDTKSVTSRTTLTLDEKESLRPDDSASMAAVEEDIPSPPSSVVAHTKQETDPDAQAFRDQLRQIGLTGDQRVIMPRAQRPLSMSVQRQVGPAFQAETPAETPPEQLELIRPRVTDPQMWVMPPDEKLLEALASPKDRLFVLKVEQDLIDFIKDPKEDFLQLPGTNSFYRMLSHKLADYYMLGHIINDDMSSVRIYRSAGCRLPPPLARSAGNTPPPSGPTRKIMRRNGEARTPDRAQGDEIGLDSLTSSKAPSDNGSGGDLNKDGKPHHGIKGKLTRAERQNRYDEARARIFKGFENKEDKDVKDTKDSVNSANDVGISRSSSVSATKRNKKQRKPKDDGFEARSAFDQYGRRISETQIMQSATESPSYGQYYFDANGQMIPAAFGFQPGQDSGMNPFAMPSPNGVHGGAMSGMSMYGMQQQHTHHYGISSPSFEPQSFGTMNGNFDSNQFSSMNNQDRTPKGTAPSLNYNQDYMQQEWGQGGYPNPYEMSGYQYPNFTPGFQQYPGGQMMQQTSPGFDGFAQPGPDLYNQSYFANGFHNQNFNPQSQSFVPNAPSVPSQQYGPQQHNGSVFVPNGSGYTMQRQASDASGLHQPQQQQQQQHHHNGRGKSNKQQNTLSKWPTPASLPAKPPQPTLQQHQSLPPKPISTR